MTDCWSAMLSGPRQEVAAVWAADYDGPPVEVALPATLDKMYIDYVS